MASRPSGIQIGVLGHGPPARLDVRPQEEGILFALVSPWEQPLGHCLLPWPEVLALGQLCAEACSVKARALLPAEAEAPAPLGSRFDLLEIGEPCEVAE